MVKINWKPFNYKEIYAFNWRGYSFQLILTNMFSLLGKSIHEQLDQALQMTCTYLQGNTNKYI